ncbi:hypothetical protein HYC85_004606 [Camellia sinensis]|uniref:Uncharacterized protein n=1 Tax=Camellia sinensis TaxID=4442 RepID=A0A7J7HYQ1_CAMSI|nr:hypothetical protein HYC85_004606 [Camellia sinensis]
MVGSLPAAIGGREMQRREKVKGVRQNVEDGQQRDDVEGAADVEVEWVDTGEKCLNEVEGNSNWGTALVAQNTASILESPTDGDCINEKEHVSETIMMEKEVAEKKEEYTMDVEEEKHQENLIPSSVGPYISKAMGTPEKIVGKKDETGIHEKWDGAKEDLTKGNEITSSSSQAVLQEPTKIVERKRQARWMLSSTSQNAEETVDHSKEDDPVEDIVVMDYAQPHRKPPIHN